MLLAGRPHRLHMLAALLVALPLGAATVSAQGPAPAAEVPRAVWDDYRRGAGNLVNGVWRVHLTAHTVQWHPRGEDGPSLTAYGFSADGGVPQVPAPMIRVTAGTPVEVTVTNSLKNTLLLRGLVDRVEPALVVGDTVDPELPAAFRKESLRLGPGETGTVRFTPTRPGSFVYFARTLPVFGPIPEIIFGGDGANGPFVGPLIVDPPGTTAPANEQVMLLTRWADTRRDATSWSVGWKMMINGRSWPATERLSYTAGDTVTWRVINASLEAHPMHLHGSYFRVDARGDQMQDTTYGHADRRMAVTEVLGGLGETMRVTWVPETPGNWLFHCHLVRHISPLQRIAGEPEVEHHGGAGGDHAHDGMAGMIMGITVQPRPGAVPAKTPPARRVRLFTGRKEKAIGDSAAYGFVVQSGEAVPAADSVLVPGSPLVLTRGEMTEIVVHNRLDFPFAVHWHGLEVESRYDGVAGWSGTPGHAAAAIEPGDSFTVRIAPPRAGTFIYHVHSEPGHQLAQGMYGALVVLEPGETFDPERDRLIVLGSEGTDIHAQMPVVNGVGEPQLPEFRAGETYRLRFIHISPDDAKRVRLLNGAEPERWRQVAKDGAELPPSLARTVPAEIRPGVGETYDVLWTAGEPGERILEIQTSFYGASRRKPHEVRLAVRIR